MDLLPDTTPVCVTFPRITATRVRWAKTPAATLSAALAQGRLAESAGGLLPKRWHKLIDIAAQGWPQIVEGEVFVALTGLQTAPRIAPQVAIGLQFGSRGVQAREWITRFTESLQREFPATKLSRERYFGKNYCLCQIEPGLDVCAAILADRLILTLGTTPMMEIIDINTSRCIIVDLYIL